MPLINCKVELKLQWTKYCVSTAAGNNTNNINSNNITKDILYKTQRQILSKTQNYMFL